MPEENEILTQIKALGDELLTRLDDIDRRLRSLEGGAAAQPTAIDAAASHSHLAPANPPVEIDTGGPLRTVGVTIRPLYDVSKVRVVEAAFGAIDGVESASLQTISGEMAHIEVKAGEDVALIGGLRRTLGVAFDVTESDDSSFTIALARPGSGREGGVAAHRAS